MSWLSPGGLLALGLLAPLIALYVLKVRRQRHVVPSTWLWASARRDLMARRPWQRLVPQVPLFLQVLALLLLALALARPATRSAGLGGDHVAVVLDVSASMAAREPDGRSRLEHAAEVVRGLLRGLPPGTSAMLIAAGREARVLAPLDRDRRRLEQALDRAVVEESEGRLGRAVALASERLSSLSGDRRIAVVTDGALVEPGALAGVALPVEPFVVGSALDNTALVRVDVRVGEKPKGQGEQVQAFAMVAHQGKEKREVFVTLRQHRAKDPLASRKLTLEPGERAPVVLTFDATPQDAGSGLVFELSPGDALTVDDRAYARVPPGRRLDVVVSPRGASPWIERALLADPGVTLSGVPLEGLASAGVPADAFLVVVGACPEALPGQDLLLVNPPPGRCRTVEVGETVQRPVVTSWNESDPRFRFLSFDGVDLASARRLRLDGARDALVRAGEHVIVADVSSPGRTATLLGFEPGDSNWPLKASFVLFIRNVVELARAHRQSGVTGPARTGEPVRVRVPWDVERVAVLGPEATASAERPARDGQAVLADVSRAGLYHVSWQGRTPGSVLLAANLASEAESNLKPVPLSASGAPGPTAAAPAGVKDWSWLLAGLALAFIALDAWWLGRRPRAVLPASLGVPPRPDRGAEGAR